MHPKIVLCFWLSGLLVLLPGPEPRPASSLAVLLAPAQRASLRSGDLVFRRAESLGSSLVLAADEDSPYSHVGLVDREGGQVLVIHAAPDPSNLDQTVRREPLEAFLSAAPLSAAFRLRQDPGGAAETAAAAARRLVGKVAFDYKLDTFSPDRVYCTELVWRAYLEAGIDLVEGRFDPVSLPFQIRGVVILPSRLSQSSRLAPLWALAAPTFRWRRP